MDKTSLGISVLNGDLRAVAFGRGAAAPVTGETNGLGENLAGLGLALLEVVEKTGTSGRTVAVALAHPRLIDQVVEVPPVTGWKLQRLLPRRVQAAKAFVGAAAWSSQPALPTKRGGAALLHLCPKAVLDQLAQGCEQAQLSLLRVLPTTAILMNQLKALPLAPDEIALLAAETGTMTTVVVGRKNGRACVGRVVRSNWNTEPERVGIDLTRSIGFAEQQSGLTVNSVWLFGSGAREQVTRLEAALKLPVKLSPVDYSPLYWAEQAATLPDLEDGNLVSRETLQAPQRKRFLTVTSLLLGFMVIVAAVAVGFVEVTRQRAQGEIAKLRGRITELRVQKSDLQHSLDELEQMKAMTQVVIGEKLPPAPALLLGYLSETVPEGLVLTQMRIARTNDFWTVDLAGSAEPGTNQPGAFRAAYTSLTNSLAAGPFHLTITRNTLGKSAEDLTTLEEVRDLPEEVDAFEKQPDNFTLQGVMR